MVCEGVLHTIKAGDTFYLLSKQHNILMEDILNANPGVNPYNLQIGQQVCIPTHLAMPEEHRPGCQGIIHTVRPGDTLYMLAKQHNLTLREIIDANPNVDCYMLQIGTKLCIPTRRKQGGIPLRTPDQIMPSLPSLPSMPSMPTMPTIPIPTMPSIPSIPSLPELTPAQPTTPAPAQPTTPAPEETPACEGFMHTIRTGDTLYMLSRQYQITLDALMRANPDLDPYNLRIGMHICIPVNNGTAESSQTQPAWVPGENAEDDHIDGRIYKTQRGDTVTRILDRYEITFAALQINNPSVDFTGPLENISLHIPSEDYFRTCPMSGAYIVKSGDSLDSISKKLLVISDRLLMANPVLTIDDFSIPGTKVCIPG